MVRTLPTRDAYELWSEVYDRDGNLSRMCARRPRGVIVISAMHPALGELGVQPRFRDPRSGKRMQAASRPHLISDYVTAARSAGLSVERLDEHAVDESLAVAYPRGALSRLADAALDEAVAGGRGGATWRSGRP